ncbi:MAG: NTP transferase domain-containing protein [Anaerolineae bacterium]
MELLALITARGGSKGIIRKNVLDVAGQPLIAWTIQAALQAESVKRVVVNTDDDEIASVAKRFGADVPFMRPDILAQDTTPSIDVLIHAIKWFQDYENYSPDYLMLLQPTSPLRTTLDIEAAIEVASVHDADAVVSVSASHAHPYWMKQVTDDGRLKDFMSPEQAYSNRQSLPPVYALNGAIYIVKPDVLVQKRTWFTDKTYAYVMPAERSLDIDSKLEMKLVDLLLRDQSENYE